MFFSKNLIKKSKIKHCFFSNKNGVSKNIYKSLNCGIGSKDKKKNVIKNLKIVKNEVSKDPDKRDYLVSNRKILNTGWKPEHSLDEGIDELIKFYPFFKGNNSTNI